MFPGVRFSALMKVEQSPTVLYWSSCGGAVQNVTTDGLVKTVSGLMPNYVYTFQVAAIGASQKIGPFSSPTNTVSLGEELIMH